MENSPHPAKSVYYYNALGSFFGLLAMAGTLGIEPRTYGLTDRRSNQLS